MSDSYSYGVFLALLLGATAQAAGGPLVGQYWCKENAPSKTRIVYHVDLDKGTVGSDSRVSLFSVKGVDRTKSSVLLTGFVEPNDISCPGDCGLTSFNFSFVINAKNNLESELVIKLKRWDEKAGHEIVSSRHSVLSCIRK